MIYTISYSVTCSPDICIHWLRLGWVKPGVYVFRCNLPPALLVMWPGSFSSNCGNTGKERKPNKSQHRKLNLEKKILLPGLELTIFLLSWGWRSTSWAIALPTCHFFIPKTRLRFLSYNCVILCTQYILCNDWRLGRNGTQDYHRGELARGGLTWCEMEKGEMGRGETGRHHLWSQNAPLPPPDKRPLLGPP